MHSVESLTSRAVVAVACMVPLIVLEAVLGSAFVLAPPVVAVVHWWPLVFVWPLGVGGGLTLLWAAANQTVVPWLCVTRVRLRLHEEAVAQRRPPDGPRVRTDSARMVVGTEGNPRFPTFRIGTARTPVAYLEPAAARALPERSERWLAPVPTAPPLPYLVAGRVLDRAASSAAWWLLGYMAVTAAGLVGFVVAVGSLPD